MNFKNINNGEINRLRIETGIRFREFRTKIAKSQVEVANAIGKSNSWLSSVENGEHNLLIHDLILLCQYYGVSTAYFLDSETNVFSQVGSDDPIEITEQYFRKLNSILPVRCPVYLQSTYTLESKGKPIDYFYWSRQKVQSREVIMIQAQTNNLCKSNISTIAKNDRVIFQINTPMREGIGAILSFHRTNFENTNGLTIAEISKDKNGNWFYWNQALAEKFPLQESQYIGMAIQSVKTYPFEEHNPMWLKYDDLETAVEPGSSSLKDTILWKE